MSSENLEAFDPTEFNDEIALKTEWKPMIGKRSNADMRELVEAKSGLLEYKRSSGFKVFFRVSIGVLILLVLVLLGPFSSGTKIFVLMMGLIFVFGGTIVYFSESSSITFDKQKQLFTRGKTKVRFEEIHAIQLVYNHVRTQDSSYVEKQINLVDKTGERVHIHAHSSSDVARANAKRISEFLNIQLWDALPS